MNRQYKFRAWDGKKMQYDFNIDCEGEIFILELEYHEIMQHFKPNWILMQFTGITDKEGIEIYEGDILEITKSDMLYGNFSSTHKVEYVEQSGKFHLIGTLYDNMAEGINNISGKNCSKVIGNIYENPKLLK